jgi:hypothetical protein
MNAVIELVEGGVVVHEEFATFEEAEHAVRNVKRRVAVKGEVFAATMFDVEVEEVDENAQVVADFDDAEYGFVTFAEAARLLGVRYQQVYQRAVVKAKMTWHYTTSNFVSLKDVEEWREARAKRVENA